MLEILKRKAQDFHILRGLEKIQKKQDRAASSDDQLLFCNLYKVNVGKWLNKYQGDGSRWKWMEEQLLDYCDENDLGDYLYMRLGEEGLELYLDEHGLFCFSDVLQGFFGVEECRRMYVFLKDRNMMPRVYRDVREGVKSLTAEQLWEYRKRWELELSKYTGDAAEIANEVGKNVRLILEAEEKSRSLKPVGS